MEDCLGGGHMHGIVVRTGTKRELQSSIEKRIQYSRCNILLLVYVQSVNACMARPSPLPPAAGEETWDMEEGLR